MKGRQLTLEEAISLSHGTKVWIETGNTSPPYISKVHTVDKKEYKFFDECGYGYNFNSIKLTSGELTIYTWDEFSREMVEAMAHEIAIRRFPNRYDVTDMIDVIVKEYQMENM